MSVICFSFYATNIPRSTVDYKYYICEHNLIKCCRGDDLLEGLLKGLRVSTAGLKLFIVSIDDLQCCLCIGGSLHLNNNGAKMCFITDIFVLTQFLTGKEQHTSVWFS